ncbi:MAG TPA: hypothetical protein VGN12_16480 [Pirellulales bacterium]|jgi:hypothetical protein
MRIAVLLVVLLAALSAGSRADDRLAAEFARRHPDVRKFNPAVEAIRREVKAGQLKPKEGKAILAAMNAGQQASGSQQPNPEQARRAYRMARAARRRAGVAADDAAGVSFANAQQAAWQANVARYVAHY